MGFIRKGKKKARITEGKDDIRDWKELPGNIVDMISERLPLIDCVSMSRVCNSWCNVFKQASPYNKKPRGLPWLIMSKQQRNIFRSCYSVLEQGNNNKKLRKLELPEAYGKYFWGTFQDCSFGNHETGSSAAIITTQVYKLQTPKNIPNCGGFVIRNLVESSGDKGPPIVNEWENSRLRKGSDSRDWGVFNLNSDHKFSYVAKLSRKWEPIWLTAPLGWC
ncbi:hypothetical protein COLO4_29555 [Corchorus olitorius]|uniref:F-box domain-containing protein n=1 Tax=Corchorus olitorius TaxID=93759 RepID=A0A1R3HE62_9ROSI|nr:hypothetical protein COLO4_29555 [Corchorus olitorius]